MSKRGSVKTNNNNNNNTNNNNTPTTSRLDDIKINVYEIIEGQIKDLIVMSESTGSRISVIENPEVILDDFEGAYVKSLKCVEFLGTVLKELQMKANDSIGESQLLLKQNAPTSTPLVVEFTMSKHVNGFDVPITCWYRLVVLPQGLSSYYWKFVLLLLEILIPLILLICSTNLVSRILFLKSKVERVVELSSLPRLNLMGWFLNFSWW